MLLQLDIASTVTKNRILAYTMILAYLAHVISGISAYNGKYCSIEVRSRCKRKLSIPSASTGRSFDVLVIGVNHSSRSHDLITVQFGVSSMLVRHSHLIHSSPSVTLNCPFSFTAPISTTIINVRTCLGPNGLNILNSLELSVCFYGIIFHDPLPKKIISLFTAYSNL